MNCHLSNTFAATTNQRRPHTMALIIMCIVLLGVSADASDFYGISKPSSQAALGFTVSARVIAVYVVDGDFVKPGDLIAEQDGSVLDARVAQLRLEAESMVEVEASEAELAQREQDLKKIGQAHVKGAATDLEFERAELEVVISRYRVKAAMEKKEAAALKMEEVLAERRQLYLKSSIGGRIESLNLTAGEAPRANEPVLLVVNTNPLWIEVPLPMLRAARLKPGDEIRVGFNDGTFDKANVLFISSVGDAASETVSVRLVMANPGNRRAGERVSIHLPSSP